MRTDESKGSVPRRLKGRLLGGLAIAAGLVASTYLTTRWLEKARNENTIQVAGSAKRRIHSDLVIWRAKVSARAVSLAQAYKALAPSLPKVVEYLTKKGIPRGEIVTSAITTHKLHPLDKEGHQDTSKVEGYEMEQSVEVTSKDIDKVTRVSRESTELIDQGIQLESEAPEYHYTKIGALKIVMLAEAAKDSLDRAQQIARSTKAKLGPLRSARMGVIQINPANSTETSSEGNNDLSSVEKDVITVVKSTFVLN